MAAAACRSGRWKDIQSARTIAAIRTKMRMNGASLTEFVMI
jgi:hypothetical protein